MPEITYKDQVVSIESPNSVLEGLENAGFEIPFSCRSGLCHSCMMQAEQSPPPQSQEGLSDNQKAQNLFLACSCFPDSDLNVSLIGDTNKIQGAVVDKKMLNATVLGLFIQVDCRWFPGQYLNVWYGGPEKGEQGRSYSIASRCDQQKIIELHIKRHDQGLVSRWLHDDVNVGETLTLSKPMGNCFYSDDHHGQPILMAATGTGLAPLFGILQEALAKEHADPIYLYAAAGDPTALYYIDELNALAAEHDNFHYIPAVRRGVNDAAAENNDSVLQQDVVDLVQERHTDLKGWKVFLCGSPEMIKKTQRHCFFQGAGVADILVDVFVIDKPV